MKTLFLLALAAVPTPALAQNQPIASHVEIIGDAAPACVMRPPADRSGTNASFQQVSAGAGRIRIEQLADPVDATPHAAEIRVLLPVICNAPHRVVLRSGTGGLRLEGPRPSQSEPFRHFLPYQLGISWGGDQARRSSDAAAPLVLAAGAARSGEMEVTFMLAGGGAPLVAGTYSDEIIIEVQVAS